jgi:hypothetical protein
MNALLNDAAHTETLMLWKAAGIWIPGHRSQGGYRAQCINIESFSRCNASLEKQFKINKNDLKILKSIYNHSIKK